MRYILGLTNCKIEGGTEYSEIVSSSLYDFHLIEIDTAK